MACNMYVRFFSNLEVKQTYRQLARHVRNGQELNPRRTNADSQPVVRAADIRRVLIASKDLGADPRGLRIRGVRIEGRLDLENVRSEIGLALLDCYLPDGIVARDASLPALVLLRCALEHPSEPPLVADRIQVAAILAIKACTVSARSDLAAVRLVAARVGGTLECAMTKIKNIGGPALDAERIAVDHNVHIRTGFLGSGTSEGAAIRFNEATVSGQVDLAGATVLNDAGPALSFDGSSVQRSLYLTDRFVAKGCGSRAVVSLRRASVGGTLVLDLNGIGGGDDSGLAISVEGLTYKGIPEGIRTGEWLSVLRKSEYAAQPYQQFAQVNRAAGHDKDVREILVAQRKHQIESKAMVGRKARTWGRFTGVMLGYGYKPARALLCLLAVFVIAVTTCILMQGALSHTALSTSPDKSCGTLERIGVGIDMGLPLVKTRQADVCQPNTTISGRLLVVFGWFYQLLAWAFATLFIAGFTKAVRKP